MTGSTEASSPEANGPAPASTSRSAELLGLFAQDLTQLLRVELELNQAEHAAQRRERVLEVAALVGGAVAGLMAAAALTEATVKALELVFSGWVASLVAAAAWATGAVLLLSAGKVRRLLDRFDPSNDEANVERLRGECLLAQQSLRVTAGKLAEVASAEAADAAAHRAVDAVEHEGEVLLRELAALLRAPGRAGIEMLGKLAGR